MVQTNQQSPAPASQPSLGRMRPGNVFYGWWLVALGGFVMTIATVPMFHGMSVWAVALEHQFHWTRTQLGFALTFTRIEGGIMGPVEGYLTDKVGTRRMVLVGMIILGFGFLMFGRIENLWMFYVAYMVMALGQGLGSWVPVMTLLNHWFQRQKSTAISRANVISRVGALALVPALAWAVDPDADRLGLEPDRHLHRRIHPGYSLPHDQVDTQPAPGIRAVARRRPPFRGAVQGRGIPGGRRCPR